jgi:hypothetical protein
MKRGGTLNFRKTVKISVMGVVNAKKYKQDTAPNALKNSLPATYGSPDWMPIYNLPILNPYKKSTGCRDSDTMIATIPTSKKLNGKVKSFTYSRQLIPASIITHPDIKANTAKEVIISPKIRHNNIVIIAKRNFSRG